MPEYLSKDIHACWCGKVVAWAVNKEGNKLPYEIKREVKVDASGGKSVVVASSDFHYCYHFTGVVTFIQHTCGGRPDGYPIQIHLPISHEHVVLEYKTGELHADITNGKSGKYKKPYGWLNVKNGGYRVQTRFDPLRELLKMIDDCPLEFDWSRGQTQARCCFCRHELIGEKSVRLGYGPVCAAKYGMPW